jgi:O-antigen ligase
VAGLTFPRATGRRRFKGRAADLGWLALVGGFCAVVLAWLLTLSPQAGCAFVLVVSVVALHQYDRNWGIAAMFGLWLLGPMLRRMFLLMTGPLGTDPLSLAPFLAAAAIAGLELAQTNVPSNVRRIILVAAAGFAIGLPLGLVQSPGAALYACLAYLAGVAGAVLGFNERFSLRDSNLRRVLLYAMPPIAAYAIAQRFLPLPVWDFEWLSATEYVSIGTPDTEIRVFGSLNGPGTLAPMLGLALLACLTARNHPRLAVVSALLLTVALSLTFVRSAWVALIAAGIAHVVASRGRSARLVLGSMAAIALMTVALAPVSPTAADVIKRFNTIGQPRADLSGSSREASFSRLLPVAASTPLGHGLGSAGEATRLGEEETELRAIDNGYLSLMYQVGPIGFLLVAFALAMIVRAAWDGARARAPEQELRLMLFAMLVFLLVQTVAGDVFYGPSGVILWFIGGQVLAYEWRRAASQR